MPRATSAERKEQNRREGLRMSLRERPKPGESNNTNSSSQEIRRAKRKAGANSRCLYDEYGRIRHNGKDVCDCLDDECPGCWYECENCGSTKCGVQCRVHRKFYYESIKFDGKDGVVNNKDFPIRK
ncbi:ARL14 effector protein-like [Musca vetustissima]|uniref:ARL14 effector protein-like n=1 Tax=Musca vetustissima TaxID=27455 RepID=UPI002AB733E5|nr:ARL14 effector protein-like [Musca vetustissima]XP_061399246.1 ARL14 effector protein-like [Musca vetustissima]